MLTPFITVYYIGHGSRCSNNCLFKKPSKELRLTGRLDRENLPAIVTIPKRPHMQYH